MKCYFIGGMNKFVTLLPSEITSSFQSEDLRHGMSVNFFGFGGEGVGGGGAVRKEKSKQNYIVIQDRLSIISTCLLLVDLKMTFDLQHHLS